MTKIRMPAYASTFGIGQEFAERVDERRQVVLNGVPDNGRAKVPVCMNREIAQIDHLPPRDLGITTGDVGRDVICGFTDDGQVVNDGVEEFFIVFECLEIHIGSEALDFVRNDPVNLVDPDGCWYECARWNEEGCGAYFFDPTPHRIFPGPVVPVGFDRDKISAFERQLGRALNTLDEKLSPDKISDKCIEFADLRKYPPGSHPSVILFRARSLSPLSVNKLIADFVGSTDLNRLAACVAVVDSVHVRVRSPEKQP